MIEIKEYKRTNAKQEILLKIINEQGMQLLEHFGTPILLILGEETSLEYYGNLDAKEFRFEGFQFPIKYVKGDLIYLIGENCKLNGGY